MLLLVRPLVLITVVLSFSLLASPAHAGVILNTLQGFDWTEPGWSGEVGTAFSASGGNTERVHLEGGGRVQWRNHRDRWQLLAVGAYEESGGVETERSVVVHLRQNHRLVDRLHTVVFAQRQHNPFQRLQSRWLLGAGLRWDLLDDQRDQIAIGATPMLEVERLEAEDDHHSLVRLSTFLLLARTLSEGVKLDGVAFYQPAWDHPADFRASASLALTVKIGGALDLRVGYGVEHDDAPPVGVEPTDWNSSLGFAVTF